MRSTFEADRSELEKQFSEIQWIEKSGLSEAELIKEVEQLELTCASKAIIKAKTFWLIANKSRIAVDKDDIFQDKLFDGDIMTDQRKRWEQAVKETYLKEESESIRHAWKFCGAYTGHGDYGHVSPNSRLLLRVGFTGLLERVEQAATREGLSEKQLDFYESCRTVLSAMITVAERLADAVEPYNKENAAALRSIARGAPKTTYEAMQLLVLYFFLHEYVAGGRVRTLGRLDVLLYPFFKRDVASGTYTKIEIREMLKYFLCKFWAAKVPFDLPFCLGGMDADGSDVTNEMSYLIVEIYNSLNIYSPKIHIRVSEKTPADFIKLVLSCIRGGNSSFVFVSDRIGIEALRRVGIKAEDAWDYVPIGCYEPAVWGVEIGCTGNGGVNLPKAVELVFNNGRDGASGTLCGVETGEIATYDAFIAAIKAQISHMNREAIRYINAIEKHYNEIYPDAILSCQYDRSVEQGIDVYEGGAKYNSSSLYYYGIATLTDAVCAVKRLVFEEKRLSFAEMGAVLQSNWSGYEKLRLDALQLKEKYGNGNPVADAVAKEFSEFCAFICNNQPNGRGGVFKAALFSIDNCFPLGRKTMATPDGRFAGDPLSKNLSATVGMDKKGITALIRSVTAMDLANFPTGSVLDIMLHPSAVSGEDGLDAFYAILTTYFALGGFAMHGNVFDAKILRAAQLAPERYQNLQVRVCGWNAYFVNLSKIEQDCFIRQAENAR